MRLFYVNRSNHYVPSGTWLRRFDQGYQKVRVERGDKGYKLGNTYGLMFPHEILAPYIVEIHRQGVHGRHNKATQMGLTGKKLRAKS